MLRIPSIIDGKEIDGSEGVLDVLDPGNAEKWAEAGQCGEAELDLAAKAARAAYDGGWSETPAVERGRLMRKVAELILRDGDKIAEYETKDVGKPISQAKKDVVAVARYFEYYGSIVECLDGDTLQTAPSVFGMTIREPFGVTGHITPWNYPLQMIARTLAPSLAAGNCCVLKPAELTPVNATVLAQLALEAGFPPGVWNVVQGPGSTVGNALTAHDGIDHVSFTGSRPVGEMVAKNAATHVIPVVLELGGKSPNIIFPDADFADAIPQVVNAIIQNAGQTCSAGSRVLIHKDCYEEVQDLIAAEFRKVTLGHGLTDPGMGPIVSAKQLDTVSGMVAEGIKRGQGDVIVGGKRAEGHGAGYFMEPTFFGNVSEGDYLFGEEVFGPVLVGTKFNDEADAVRLANATEFGLVAGIWTKDAGRALRMAKKIKTGQVFINTYGAAGGVELPFGGWKKSGYGREKGFEGMLGYTQTKTIAIGL
ncbi:MAG: aldehyde dehydrogenase family protein [Sporichthyaceae bacterium]